MAESSSVGARAAVSAAAFRSGLSRYYYAAYQGMTAVMLYQGLTPPAGREAWSHEETPRLVQERFEKYVRSRDRRNDLANRLSRLYKMRVSADYLGGIVVSEQVVERARKDSEFLLKAARAILPE